MGRGRGEGEGGGEGTLFVDNITSKIVRARVGAMSMHSRPPDVNGAPLHYGGGCWAWAPNSLCACVCGAFQAGIGLQRIY